MMVFTSFSPKNKRRLAYFLAILFWLAIWHISSIILKSELALVSPVSVAYELIRLVKTPAFWKTAAFSISRIMSGFLLSAVIGTAVAALAYRVNHIRTLLAPLVSALGAVPVASYVVLCLIFVKSANLSFIIAFLMSVPVMYLNMLEVYGTTDSKLLEMARVFNVPSWRRITHIYIPHSTPFFKSASAIALGISWKSGVAAEVIGLPSNSIGIRIYESKLYLDTKGLFAWTVLVMLLCWLFSKLLTLLVNAGIKRLERS